MYTCMCNWVTMLYSRKLTEHCKLAIIKKNSSYTKLKKRKVNNMARNYTDIQEAMEKAYPGYKFIDAEIKYNGVNAAFYIYARMVRN